MKWRVTQVCEREIEVEADYCWQACYLALRSEKSEWSEIKLKPTAKVVIGEDGNDADLFGW